MENNEVNPQEQSGVNAEAVNQDAAVNAEKVEAVAAPVAETVSLDAAREEAKNKRAQSAEEEAELDSLMSGVDLNAVKTSVVAPVELETNAKFDAKVIKVEKDQVFVELPGKAQGVLTTKPDENAPEEGATNKVVITKPLEDGQYEVRLPGTAVTVEDWTGIEKDMVVEATVTGHNTGGLECRVNNLRAFIPFNQIAAYRVENVEEFIGQKFECLVIEVNPKRRNLVISRRKILERERAAKREELIKQLQPGQIYEGTVRKIMDFGAFVDIGGIDGLLHVSQLSWERVKHPSDVLKEGQKIRVQVEKVDPVTKKISFGYRSLQGHPWDNVAEKFPVDSTVTGKVTKIMTFGAFVELAKGVEGLVHISEISYQRVNTVGDVLKVGDVVTAKVLSVDTKARRISLSIKALTEAPPKVEKPEREKKEQAEEKPFEAPVPKGGRPRATNRPLRGGIGNGEGGLFG